MTTKNTCTKYIIVAAEYTGQRIDNFLVTRLKSVPKSHIYKIIRKGEVRINMKRITPCYRLNMGDKLRLPPIMLKDQAKLAPINLNTIDLLMNRILYEDDSIL